MRGRALLVAMFSAVLVVAIWANRAGKDIVKTSPIPSVDNPGPPGLEAAYTYLAERGAAKVLDRDLGVVPSDARTILIALPLREDLAEPEVRAVQKWVSRGGNLVILGQHGGELTQAARGLLEVEPVALDLSGREVGIAEIGRDVKALLESASGPAREEVVPARPAFPDLLTQGIRRLAISDGKGYLAAPGEAIPLFTAGDTPVALALSHGSGRLVVLAGSDALANGRIDLDDNLQLLQNLAARGLIYFDEFHHHAASSAALREVLGWLTPGLLQGLAIGLLVLAASFRRLGPPRVNPPGYARSSREYVERLGHMYRRAKAEGRLVVELRASLRSRLQDRAGISATVGEAEAAARLGARRPELSTRFLALCHALAAGTEGATPERFAELSRQVAELEQRI